MIVLYSGYLGNGMSWAAMRAHCVPIGGSMRTAFKEDLSNAASNAFAVHAEAAVGGVWAGCGQRGVSRLYGCPHVVHGLSTRPEGPSIALRTICPCPAPPLPLSGRERSERP